MKYDVRHAKTLLDALTAAVEEKPTQEHFVYLSRDLQCVSKTSYADLMGKAQAIAAHLQQHQIQPGDRVLVIYDTEIEFLHAFLGCMYARAIAVPCYPPANLRLIEKLSAIITNCQPKFILSSSLIIKKIGQLKLIKFFKNVPFLNTLFQAFKPDMNALTQWQFDQFTWIATDKVNKELASQYRYTPSQEHDIAFLQYTSGSTSTPKGVIIRHDNLINNLGTIARSFKINRDDAIVTWLPQYHDMGLIGSLLGGLANHIPTYIMSPIDFIKRPGIWLEAITQFNGTLSAAPNFAYALCNHKISDEVLKRLDLSTWRVALCGSEPINFHILNQFAERFADCNFKKEAFHPSYGLAEATLFVSGKQGLVMHKLADPLAKPLVNCGPVYDFDVLQACRYLVINSGTSESPEFTRRRDRLKAATVLFPARLLWTSNAYACTNDSTAV